MMAGRGNPLDGRPVSWSRRSPRRAAIVVAATIVGAVGLWPGLTGGAAAAGAAPVRSSGPYSTAPFEVTKLPYRFGQDPSWTHDSQILSAQNDSAGIRQIYRARPDGTHQACLTCSTVEGPNGLPQERPEGDWILFESFGQQPTHSGGPGLGGYGGDLYVMHPDGSHAYRLTTTSDPDGGARFSTTAGTPYDNFHAYWSPDGRQIVWTHTEAAPLGSGGQTWEMLLGDFSVAHGVPSLTGVRVVGRPYGAYETQPWSPDGKGFLFFAAGGYRSPFQVTPPGWANTRVYYMRLFGRGASPEHPRVTLVTDNAPLYEEQAIFTPDMGTVIMMSNRGATLGSWYGLVAAAAQRTGYDAPDTGSTQTLQFLADFDGPDFHSDLFAVDLHTRAVRRLTHLDGVIPEFYWNHDETRILWSMGGQGTATYTARFLGITVAEHKVPATTPPWLTGQPVDMTRVGEQAQAVRDPGPTDDTSVAVVAPATHAQPFPHRPSADKAAIPAVVATYLTAWLADLPRARRRGRRRVHDGSADAPRSRLSRTEYAPAGSGALFAPEPVPDAARRYLPLFGGHTPRWRGPRNVWSRCRPLRPARPRPASDQLTRALRILAGSGSRARVVGRKGMGTIVAPWEPTPRCAFPPA